MKKIILSTLIVLFYSSNSNLKASNNKVQDDLLVIVNKTLMFAEKQYSLLANKALSYPGGLPKTFENDSIVMVSSKWWTSGFAPGTLWYLYENSHSNSTKDLALRLSNRVEDQKFTTDNHDVGFMIYCSFGNAYRLDPQQRYKSIIIQASKSLSTRFDKRVGLIRSWDFNKNKWQYPVIIDNMMNLEMLCEATKLTGDSSYYKIAISHADKTMANHFRKNMSCYHVVSYDTITGEPHIKQTWQGFNNESEWSRGQGWALYGYTMMYRMTGKKNYLELANKVAGYLIHHPNMPKDYIPYWDFCDPKIPNTLRDASAGAVICSALLELSNYVPKTLAKQYLTIAKIQLRALCSPKYIAKVGEQGGFLLKHSVGSIPHKTEIDVPLTYADYYFVEAMLRYKAMVSKLH
jgi:rhamnogalacturonyl hydrolase YesR